MDKTYRDYLKEYIKGLVEEYIKSHKLIDNLPTEFEGISHDNLVGLLLDDATPVLRGLEDIAIRSAVARVCFMIRFAQRQAKVK